MITENQLNLDMIIKLLIKKYKIVTEKDIKKLISKTDSMEAALKTHSHQKFQLDANSNTSFPVLYPSSMTSSDTVLEIIKDYKAGINFKSLQEKTGFIDKKLRNIIFRLCKIKKIKRKSRGVYIII